MLPREVAFILSQSKRPLIHIGQGVRHAGAEREFDLLKTQFNIPYITGRNGNDLVSSDDRLNIGRAGTFAQRGANFAVQLCDLYIAIGTRLSLPQTGYNSKDYARNAQIIQVDVDQAELDKGTLRDPVKIRADAREFIAQLTSEMADLPKPDWSSWVTRCQSLRDRYPVCLPEYKDEKGYVNSYHFIDTLSDLCTEDDTIVTDMGFSFQCTHQAWKVKSGQRLMTNCGLAPMGWGLPAAVGAAFATGRRVICITGDGGIMMNIQELATVMHHKLNIKIFVLNNGGYATIKQTQQLGFDGRLMGVDRDTGLSFPDFQELSRAHGIPHSELRNHDDFRYLANMLSDHEPLFCEVMMNPDQPQAPRAVNRRNPDGTMNPTKLEDAYPFLDPAIIEQEMRLD